MCPPGAMDLMAPVSESAAYIGKAYPFDYGTARCCAGGRRAIAFETGVVLVWRIALFAMLWNQTIFPKLAPEIATDPDDSAKIRAAGRGFSTSALSAAVPGPGSRVWQGAPDANRQEPRSGGGKEHSDEESTARHRQPSLAFPIRQTRPAADLDPALQCRPGTLHHTLSAHPPARRGAHARNIGDAGVGAPALRAVPVRQQKDMRPPAPRPPTPLIPHGNGLQSLWIRT